jgi:hypothetical protein
MRRSIAVAPRLLGLIGLLAASSAIAAGCGVALTGALVGGLLATGGKKSSGASNSPPQIDAAAVTGSTSTGTVAFGFTISDQQSSATLVVVNYSTDPNESSQKPFAKVATGLFVDGGGAQVATTNLATSPGGVSYTFRWNTAQDLSTTLTQDARLQIVLGGVVAFTTAPFTVDNTSVPLVVSATPGALPTGAGAYADDQQAAGFIPVSVVFAQAQSTPVAVGVLFSTDGGVTFPATNVAVGQLFDASQSPVALDQVPTSPSGIGYTFRFISSSNALGTSSAQSVVLQFMASDTKASTPRDTAAFVIDNAAFTAVLETPSAADVFGSVSLFYSLLDNASDPADVTFEFSLDGAAGPFMPCNTITGLVALSGTTDVTTSPGGTGHEFVWNAYADMLAPSVATPECPTTLIQVFVTKRLTQVKRGPFATTRIFTVDHRLIQTVVGRTSAAAQDGVLATAAQLGQPLAVATAGTKVYFTDPSTVRLRVIDTSLPSPIIETALGGGSQSQPGTLAVDFGLASITGAAASSRGSGALFVSGANLAQVPQIFRVDGSTPLVTTLATSLSPLDTFGALAYEPAQDLVYFLEDLNGVFEVFSVPAAGGSAPTLVAGGGAIEPVDALASPVSPPTAALFNGPAFLAADWTLLPDMVLVSDTASTGNGRILAINLNGTTAHTVAGVVVAPGSVQSVAFSAGFTAPAGILIQANGAITVVDASNCTITAIDGTGAATVVAGTGDEGYSGDCGDPTLADLGAPEGIAFDPSTGGFFFCDSANNRVRRVAVSAPCPPQTGPASTLVTTVAGTFNDHGDGFPATQAALGGPRSVALIPNQLLVADNVEGRIRAVDLTTRVIGAFAGNGLSTVNDAAGVSSQAAIALPTGMIATPAGDIYVTEGEAVIRKITGAGVISTIAGLFQNGSPVRGVPVDHALAVTSLITSPRMLTLVGECLVFASNDDNLVGTTTYTGLGSLYAINIGSVTTSCCGVPGINPGEIVRIAGLTGSNNLPSNPSPTMPAPLPGDTVARVASFIAPTSIASVSSGDVFVSDFKRQAVYQVNGATGAVSVAAGTENSSWGNNYVLAKDGPVAMSRLSTPANILVDPTESLLYIADHAGATDPAVLRAVNLTAATIVRHGVTIPAGNIELIAGNTLFIKTASLPPTGDDGPGLLANIFFKATGGNMAVDAAGTLYFNDPKFEKVRSLDANGTIQTVVGQSVLDGDGSPAVGVTLTRPSAIAAAADGSVAVVDLGRVRFVPPDTTLVDRLAGNAAQGYSGDGGPAIDATFDYVLTPPASVLTNAIADVSTQDRNGPRQIAFSSGTALVTSLIAVADTRDHSIRLINTGTTPYVLTTPGAQFTLGAAPPPAPGTPLVAGEVLRLAGSVNPATGLPQAGFAGDGALVSTMTTTGVQTAFADPQGVAFTSSGLLIVSDTTNNRIRAINLLSSPSSITVQGAGVGTVVIPAGFIQTIATGVVLPRNLAIEPATQLILFTQGDLVSGPSVSALNIGPATIAAYGTTIASGAIVRIDNAASAAFLGLLDDARGIATDPNTGDCYYAIRTSNVVCSVRFTDGHGTIVAGELGSGGFSGDGGVATSAQLSSPSSVAVDAFGSIYVLDGGNFRVRRCRPFP